MPSQRDERIVNETLQEFSQLQSWRSTFEPHWEEAAELVAPSYRNTFNYGNFNQPGEKKTERQVDATGMLANSRFAAILDSLLTPRNMKWHMLSANDDALMKDRATRLWFERVTNMLFKQRYAPIANFASQNQQLYQGLGAFGNGCMFVDQAVNAAGVKLPALRYKAISIGEMYLKENHQGLIDGFIRVFRLNARQAMQRWGDKCPEMIKAAYEKNSQTPFTFLHRVCPRDDYDPERIDARGKLFASYYVSMEGKTLMEEGGYNSFPVAASRYDQAPGEVYGRGPTMMVLPALKTLNAQKRVFLKVGHRAADPVLLTGDDGLIGSVNLRPGAINPGGVNSDGRPLVVPLPSGDPRITIEMMQQERELVNDANLVTLFQILTETGQMTATEVIERTNEKGILLAPTVGRQQSEYLGPLIDREIDLLAEMGVLPPMPPALREARGEYQVVYTSPLSRAQRAQEVAGGFRTLEMVTNIVNVTQDPSLLDRFDFDAMIPDVASIQAVPETWMASDEQVAAKREARAAQLQAQQEIQAAPAAAAMIKAQATAAKTNPGG